MAQPYAKNEWDNDMKIANRWASLLSTVVISVQLYATQPEQEAQKQSLEYVKQEIEVLDQLTAAVHKAACVSKHNRLSRADEVNKLLAQFQFDQKVQDMLSDDITIILISSNNT